MLPDYWMHRPPIQLDQTTRQAFDELLAAVMASGPGAEITYTLTAPRWQFLCYLADNYRLLVHGSGNPDIEVFEPRQPIDLSDFGNQRAVYAASDGLWAMFYAILNRDQYPMSLCNACISVVDGQDQQHGPFYVFSISQQALLQQPWCSGSIYLLPRDTFIQEAPIRFGDLHIWTAQWASQSAVQPLARLAVEPDDFPFLQAIRGHDDNRLHEYAHALQTAGPWPE